MLTDNSLSLNLLIPVFVDLSSVKIDVSKLMGYDSELDKTFDILDKNYHGKGGNE